MTDSDDDALTTRAALDRVLDYHQRTKHHFRAYARGPGRLDWASQPDPFRHYAGARTITLERIPPNGSERFEEALAGTLTTQSLNRSTLSRLLYDSLALSAWKQAGTTRWALRVNPSSGNLHPTEAYLICGPVPGVAAHPMVAHYAPRDHVLEVRAEIPPAVWAALGADLPPGAILLGLCSIPWREAWKYGERAYRYCQHDVGHATATVTIAAAGLGWRTALLDHLSTDAVGLACGVADSSGPEAEQPDCLLAVWPSGPVPTPSEQSVRALGALSWQGQPNRLSPQHVDWPAIDAVASACGKPATARADLSPAEPAPIPELPASGALLRACIHRRRSAVAMDGVTALKAGTFYAMLAATLPYQHRHPFATLPWQARVHLLLFVHRVRGLEPGLYLLVRNSGDEAALRSGLHRGFDWFLPPGCPPALPLYRLVAADLREVAIHLSCHQDIAGDGCFSLGMLTRFEPALHEQGAWIYPRLFWECGMIGQVLYLEAVACGVAGTGIGCFFDDPVHEAVGLQELAFQSLYHFTVGGPVEDPRLMTLPPYPRA